jgi:uncharacterized membrane protein YdjX (TVP38/TMEM64 family)
VSATSPHRPVHRDSDSDKPTGHKSSLTWLIPLGFLAALVGFYFLWPEYRAFVDRAWEVLGSEDQQNVEDWVRSYGGWGFVVILGLMLMQTLIPFLPSVIAMVAAVLAYGPLLGGTIAWLGMLLAATLGYAIGRTIGPVTVDRLMGEKNRRKVGRLVERYGLWAVIAARISPVLSTDAVSIVAGLAFMNYWRFLLATALGTLPLTILIAWLGADIDRLKSGLIWVSVISVALFLAYVVYDRRRMAQKMHD